MNILQGKPYKKDNVMKSFLATPGNCDAIALQYQDLEAKMKNLDHISVSLDSYTRGFPYPEMDACGCLCCSPGSALCYLLYI